jgi:hypothetical protein
LADSESGDRKRLAHLLPEEISGWRPAEPDGLYSADTLFDLIDGGAEVYRALNVKKVISRRYEKTGAPEIIADIFDMGSSNDAFGAYHHDMREGEDGGVGVESEFLETSLYFWKDRYFISLIALDESEEVPLVVKKLAKAIDAAIPREGMPPDLLTRLPSKGRVARQTHYFHDKMLLDRHYFIARENLLGLSGKTEGVLARYKPAKEPEGKKAVPPTVLLLVLYPTEAEARNAYKRFKEGFLEGEGDIVRMKKGGWSGAALKGDLFVGVFDAPTREAARELIDEVLKPKPVSKQKQGEDR